jgi:hypothetical protein
MTYKQNFFLLENKITGDSPDVHGPRTDRGNPHEYLPKNIHKNAHLMTHF